MSNDHQGRILLPIGDPNGIGPEVAVKAATILYKNHKLRPILVGDISAILNYSQDQSIPLATSPNEWNMCSRKIDVFPVASLPSEGLNPGTITAEAGEATIAYVKAALSLVASGVGKAIVGCPHSETAVNLSGRNFSGYPNLLAELLDSGPDSVFMMLVGGGLRIIHVTLHESVAGALARLTPDLIVDAVMAGVSGLTRLGIERPRIGLFGINPHAGEDGLFGTEEQEIVVPAINILINKGINVEGPEGADVMLQRHGFDAFVAMYHDQGHIPVKFAAGRAASALSVGSDILFSSVGHGAAFDIAGKGLADPEAVIRTIQLLG